MILFSLIVSLGNFVGGCVPSESNAVLARYEGSVLVKAKQFVSLYQSYLASSNDSGFDPVRLQALQAFLAPLSPGGAPAVVE